MSCNCKIGGGPDGVCAFHRAAAAQAKKDKLNAARQQWMIEQIKRLAAELDISLDPLP